MRSGEGGFKVVDLDQDGDFDIIGGDVWGDERAVILEQRVPGDANHDGRFD
jgi:hypothetical protein